MALAVACAAGLQAGAETVRLTQAQVTEDLAVVRAGLEGRFAHYFRNAPPYSQRLAEIAERSRGGMTVDELGVELAQVVALFHDSHAVVRGYSFPEGALPFLLEPLGDRLVAFAGDRSAFVVRDHPFITAIDGRPIDEWRRAARRFVALGSPAYVAVQTSGILRNVNLIRRALGVQPSPTVTIRVEADDRRSTRDVTLRVAPRAVELATWPAGTSRWLDGRVLYLRLPTMDQTAADDVRRWAPQLASAAGLIIDVRGNVGGSRRALEELAPYLLPPDEPARVVNVAKYRLNEAFGVDHLAARSLHRDAWPGWTLDERAAIGRVQAAFQPEWVPPPGAFSEWHYMVLSRAQRPAATPYRGRVVVLMDRRNFSATDIFLSALKGLPDVTLVGTPTSGGSSFTRAITTPNAKLQLHLGSMASFQRDGRLYDGAGIQPDLLVESEPSFVLNGGRDVQLERALELLRPR